MRTQTYEPLPRDLEPQSPLRAFTPRWSENVNGASERRPAVSVVVPCKNDARYLSAALESIFSQDYPLLDCIVVDGGSTDGTVDLLKGYGARIRWLSEPDRGAFDAINRGWQLSNGEILTWLNADDLWEPGAVRTVVDFFDRRPDVVYGTAGVVDDAGRVHGDVVPCTWDLEYALRHCYHVIFQPASFMRRRILERVGWLYPSWCHDHDLWLRIARAGTFARLPVRLALDRTRPGNLGAQPEIVVPAKLALTQRFFADPGLPPSIRRLQRRAVSSAYVLAVDYLRPAKSQDWLLAVRSLAQAVAVDPGNTGLVGVRLARLFRRCGKSLLSRSFRLSAKILARGAGMSWHLTRLALPAAVADRWSGRVVHWLFAGGKPGRRFGAGDLRRRREAAERADFEAMRSVTGRIERTAADIARLTARMDRNPRAPIEPVESLRCRHEKLRKEMATLRQGRSLKRSEGWLGIHGTPPAFRRIPGWHTNWGTDTPSDPGFSERLGLWSSLRGPVLMRWAADLLIAVWPGNELSRVVFLTGQYEPNELIWMNRELAEGMTVIDIGAHIGLYSMIASRRVGESGVVIAMEPSAREFQRLAFHVTLNDLRNIRCIRAAASDASGEARLSIAWEWNSGHNTLGKFFNPAVATGAREAIRTQTIDALVAAQRLARVDLVKIDVEGHELKVLAGASETLTRFRPRVLVEVFEETLRRQGASVEAVLAFLEGHGYALHEFSDRNGELVPLSQRVVAGSRNVVALARRLRA